MSPKENVGPFGPRKWQGEKVKTGPEPKEVPAQTTRTELTGHVVSKAEQARLSLKEARAKKARKGLGEANGGS